MNMNSLRLNGAPTILILLFSLLATEAVPFSAKASTLSNLAPYSPDDCQKEQALCVDLMEEKDLSPLLKPHLKSCESMKSKPIKSEDETIESWGQCQAIVPDQWRRWQKSLQHIEGAIQNLVVSCQPNHRTTQGSAKKNSETPVWKAMNDPQWRSCLLDKISLIPPLKKWLFQWQGWPAQVQTKVSQNLRQTCETSPFTRPVNTNSDDHYDHRPRSMNCYVDEFLNTLLPELEKPYHLLGLNFFPDEFNTVYTTNTQKHRRLQQCLNPEGARIESCLFMGSLATGTAILLASLPTPTSLVSPTSFFHWAQVFTNEPHYREHVMTEGIQKSLQERTEMIEKMDAAAKDTAQASLKNEKPLFNMEAHHHAFIYQKCFHKKYKKQASSSKGGKKNPSSTESNPAATITNTDGKPPETKVLNGLELFQIEEEKRNQESCFELINLVCNNMYKGLLALDCKENPDRIQERITNTERKPREYWEDKIRSCQNDFVASFHPQSVPGLMPKCHDIMEEACYETFHYHHIQDQCIQRIDHLETDIEKIVSNLPPSDGEGFLDNKRLEGFVDEALAKQTEKKGRDQLVTHIPFLQFKNPLLSEVTNKSDWPQLKGKAFQAFYQRFFDNFLKSCAKESPENWVTSSSPCGRMITHLFPLDIKNREIFRSCVREKNCPLSLFCAQPAFEKKHGSLCNEETVGEYFAEAHAALTKEFGIKDNPVPDRLFKQTSFWPDSFYQDFRAKIIPTLITQPDWLEHWPTDAKGQFLTQNPLGPGQLGVRWHSENPPLYREYKVSYQTESGEKVEVHLGVCMEGPCYLAGGGQANKGEILSVIPRCGPGFYTTPSLGDVVRSTEPYALSECR